LLSSNEFRVGHAAKDADDRIIYKAGLDLHKADFLVICSGHRSAPLLRGGIWSSR